MSVNAVSQKHDNSVRNGLIAGSVGLVGAGTAGYAAKSILKDGNYTDEFVTSFNNKMFQSKDGKALLAICSLDEKSSTFLDEMVKVIKEEQIHAYNAMAGCSPAFMYILIEAMSDAGVVMGIDRKTSIEMAAQVFKGTGAMVLESGKHPAQLKDGVCTPGGLTIKGVEVLEEKGLRSGIIESVIASYNKSIESEKK